MNLMAKLTVKFMVAIGDSSLCPGVFFLGRKEVRAGNILSGSTSQSSLPTWPRSLFTVDLEPEATLKTVARAAFTGFLPPFWLQA